MFFADHEKRVYSPPGSDAKFDPLAIDHALVIATGGALRGLLRDWRASTDGLGDIGEGSAETNAVLSTSAEVKLAAAARSAFGLPPFGAPDYVTDAHALELLLDYLEWMEGKGQRGKSPHDSTTSGVTTLPETTRSS